MPSVLAMDRNVLKQWVRPSGAKSFGEESGATRCVDHRGHSNRIGTAVCPCMRYDAAIRVEHCLSCDTALEHTSSTSRGVLEQDLIKSRPWYLDRLRTWHLIRLGEVRVLVGAAISCRETGAPFLDESFCRDDVRRTDCSEDFVDPWQLRLPNVKPWKVRALENDHPVPSPRQDTGGSRSSRTATDHRHIKVLGQAHEKGLRMSWDNISPVSQISSLSDASSGDPIIEAFSRLVRDQPGRPLVVAPSRSSTMGDVDTLSHAVSRQVQSARLPENTLVALAAPNGLAFLAGFLALRRMGFPVLLTDPAAPHEDRRRAVASLGAGATLECTSSWPSSPREYRLTVVASASPVGVADIAVVKLTSGSTGTPRGVAMRAEQLLADEAALRTTMRLNDDDRLLGAIPFSHSYGFTTLVLSALVRGTMLVVPTERGPFSPLVAAREFGATVFPTVPVYVQALLNLSPPPPCPPSIRLVISAGAPLSSSTAAQFRRTYGQPLHAFYGSSECGGICYDREGGAAERGTVGTPVEGARVSLLPPGESAETEGVVVVESPGVGELYLPMADERLRAGRFETSDIGVWSGGELTLLRRIDRVINVRGRKVDPSEVETVLADLTGVAEVVVFGTASPNGTDEVVRAVVVCPSIRPDVRHLTAWCRHRLADHKVPRSIVFVDAMPRTSRGKVDRVALLKLYASSNDSDLAHG